MQLDSAYAIDVAVGQVIRRYRTRRGLSVHQLAKAMGASVKQISRYENGINRLSIVRLFQLAEAIDVPPYYLIAEIISESSQSFGTSEKDLPVIELLSSPDGQKLIEAVSEINVSGVDAAIGSIAKLADQYVDQSLSNATLRILDDAVDADNQG